MRAVQDILVSEWNPLGVKGHPDCRDEYDSFAIAFVPLLQAGADEFKIAGRLSLIQRVEKGLKNVNDERNHQVARRLHELTSNLSAKKSR
ncbi:MAG: hypothetical protein HYX68_03450 [Planctomycetes bacterium]|nr:hypothetical protein [Planctomycetota bacterium]